MAERIKLNKISLREQKQKLAMYRRFLPALEARKQQLLAQLADVRARIAEQEARLQGIMREISTWGALLADMGPLVRYFIEIREIRSSFRNVAGLQVPQFHGVAFSDQPYSYFATPPSFEEVILQCRGAIECREELRMLREGERILYEGFRKTSQRINLYEQRLIPGCREAIRRIVVYLQDQQAAGVGVAKVAKRLTEAAMHGGTGESMAMGVEPRGGEPWP
ncbi:MAG TPA: V-type ATP synthase subunit D [Deltaproteobacteria bacterium]|nr:V-type ATP synthase subunit D [Deltaproteobacteria bacterium]HQI81472.1 V-type ATP synthase subunit D [Deltaproteobacteria bacterium]